MSLNRNYHSRYRAIVVTRFNRFLFSQPKTNLRDEFFYLYRCLFIFTLYTFELNARFKSKASCKTRIETGFYQKFSRAVRSVTWPTSMHRVAGICHTTRSTMITVSINCTVRRIRRCARRVGRNFVVEPSRG